MGPAATIDRGGGAIDSWIEPCPHCGREVPVAENARRVACAHCGTDFVPDGKPTVVGRRRPVARSDAGDSLIGSTLGRWTLTRLIGRGGMGRVYEARDTKKGRRVALKILREDLAADPSFVRRFHREAKLLASLSHPHVVEVLDQGEQDGHLYFAMEYVRGENLRRRIERGRVKPKEAARIAAEIASALAYAHRAGVIHRDLKPENVLLDESGGVHLVDFGLSRLVGIAPNEASTRLTRTDVILGTYEYMSPEQRRGERQLDGRADVFALGVILYEMLTGSLPLGRFTPPSDVARDIPRAFDEVINRSLAPAIKERYPNAGAFEAAIRKAGGAKPPKRPKQPIPLVGEAVPAHEVDEARSILRHVEIIAALDRVGGIVLILGALGFFSIFPFLMPLGIAASFGGVVFFLLGLYMLSLGRRVSKLQPGARHSQVTAAVIMLFFPPFLTALGIYALIVMTSDSARRAFRLGRKVLGDEKPHPIFVSGGASQTPKPRPRAATFLMRTYTLLAILWSLYVGFLALDVFAGQAVWSQDLVNYKETAHITSIAVVVSLVIVIRMWFVRRRRRGVGLAVAAFLFLYGAFAMLSTAIEQARDNNAESGRSAAIRALPRWHAPRFSRYLHWEIPK